MPSNKDFNKKLYYSASAALVFVLVALPQVYDVTNNLFNTSVNGCPTPQGLLFHTFVFFALLFFLMKTFTMKGSPKPDGVLAKYAFWSALIFFLLSSTEMYSMTGKVFPSLANNGCPTLNGVLVHGLVFMFVLVLVMYFPHDMPAKHYMAESNN